MRADCHVIPFCLASKYGVRPEDILLVHDELDKPLGKVAIKHGGSARLVPESHFHTA